MASRQWKRFDGTGLKALQPRLDGLRFKADEAMNATARDFVLGSPEVERGFFDVEPRGEFFDGKHDVDPPGESRDTPSPPNMGCPRDRRQAGETDWVVA